MVNSMQDAKQLDLDASWQAALAPVLSGPVLPALKRFLSQEIALGKTIYPAGRDIFNALNRTPLDQVRAVILGQDPYHGPGQAHGLAFSVQPGVPIPPSLRNIFTELSNDLSMPKPPTGDLSRWADSGVLLLNTTLTVEAGKAGSHQGQGWELFTDHVIDAVAKRREPVVFMLWGAQAQRKAERVGAAQHKVLSAPHPSPLSAHRGFLGCRHFSQCNAFLTEVGSDPIAWDAILDAPD